MRRIFLRPQIWAISVALLAQGDTVPSRGTTRSGVPAGGGGTGSPSFSSFSRSLRSAAPGVPSASTKYRNWVSSCAIPGRRFCSFSSRIRMRKGERAGPPRNWSIFDPEAGAERYFTVLLRPTPLSGNLAPIQAHFLGGDTYPVRLAVQGFGES